VHSHAQLAAEAAEAAGAQGKFWEMHDALYLHEDLDRSHILQYARDLGLDMDRFQRELAEHKYADKVREDFNSGIRSGVNGTPTFFINGERYDEAWDIESLLERVRQPAGVRAVQLLTTRFTRLTASGGIVLLIATIIALLWRNSAWAETYIHLWETSLSINLGSVSLSEHLLEWINGGLMVIFFFVVGLEIKREILTGELASPRKAALPVAGAIGGMLVPAIIYLAFNLGGPGEAGWGVPVATDIAFTLGILTVLGSRVPLSLKVFFTALAIADDLGAILVIAIFYTAEIEWIFLLAALGILLILIGLNYLRVYSPLPYAIFGIGLWLMFLESGVHPTIAGVLLALTIPSRSPPDLRALLAQAISTLQSLVLPNEWREKTDSSRQAVVSTVENIAERMLSPGQRMERDLTPWTTYLIIPIFALANAGVAIDADSLGNLLSPVSLGIILGLVVGKPLGITALSWLATRLGWAELPAGVHWPQFIAASSLAGIGFTVSLFISSAAFTDPEILDTAKLAILIASTVAAAIGALALYVTSPEQEGVTEMAVPVSAD
jgi:NhaA family Na+:H+ antiporter